MTTASPTSAPRFGTDDDAPAQVRSAAPVPLARVLNPAAMLRELWRGRELIRQFSWREVVGRNKGTQLGMVWTFLNPLLILVVNTFVFAVVLRQNWNVLGGGPAEFPLTMLCGMTVFGVFAETVCAAPTMIVSRPNFVTRVVFPIEIFPVSALGVFLRDINSIVGLVVYRVLVFMTPLFFPATAVPERFRPVLEYNPLTVIVESARRTLMWSQAPDWHALGWVTAGSLVAMQLGYAWFVRSKRGFADVI